MASLVLDTHALVWYLMDSSRLSPIALSAIDKAIYSEDAFLYISMISLIELVYLIEKGKLPTILFQYLAPVLEGQNTEFQLVPVEVAIFQTIQHIPRAQVPDMPDRIIAATALHLGLPLLTKDRQIQTSSIQTIW